jgi:hypothetical protein
MLNTIMVYSNITKVNKNLWVFFKIYYDTIYYYGLLTQW